jgi:hypothetical protein
LTAQGRTAEKYALRNFRAAHVGLLRLEILLFELLWSKGGFRKIARTRRLRRRQMRVAAGLPIINHRGMRLSVCIYWRYIAAGGASRA